MPPLGIYPLYVRVCVYVLSRSIVSVSLQPHGQAPLSMEFSRPAYWRRLLFHTVGDLPDLGIEPLSLVSSALAGRFFTPEPPMNQITFTTLHLIATYVLITKTLSI